MANAEEEDFDDGDPSYSLDFAPIGLNRILHLVDELGYGVLTKIISGGKLRARCPKLEFEWVYHQTTGTKLPFKRPTLESARAAFLWRSLAYHLSPFKADLSSPPDPRSYFDEKVRDEEVVRWIRLKDMILLQVPQQYYYGKIARGET